MLKQEELAFIKALSNFELSPALLRELKKAMAARRRRTKALAPCKDKTYNIAITEGHSTGFGAGCDAQPSRKLLRQLAGRLAMSFPAQRVRRCPSPDAQRPVRYVWTGTRSSASRAGATGNSVLQRVAGVCRGGSRARPSLQSSGPLKPTANGSDISEPVASSEAADRRMSAEDMSGPLAGMPAGTIWVNNVVPAGERIKTPIFVSGVTDTVEFLTWLRARSRG
jgi:hypothetical protein